MSFHRTGGKGGTRNSVRERHADRFLPNFNKSQGSGRVARGRRKDNPPSSPRDNYDAMMTRAKDLGIPPDPDPVGDFLLGPSPVRRPRPKKKK